ncbi:DgyrCDS6268 [Dimorphilus gyrociliatus]|uniref:Endosome-associated-trafficking regulator 1 n=1 Tax=Dimorphilus gyrociliatus TaxID=2664684 RepID=A0A7I8VQD3_9ANNE|nr:DgyrCDS6268 [Dimorphilus gyrociliatus]
MATGGGDENSNPFSYRNFVKHKRFSNNDSTENDESDRNAPVMRLDLVDDEKSSINREDNPSTRRNRQGDNSFSLRKFLKTSSKSSNGHLSKLDLANDLPDFVQDHIPPSPNLSRQVQPGPSNVSLPDFALDSNPSPNHEPPMSNPAATIEPHRTGELPEILSDSQVQRNKDSSINGSLANENLRDYEIRRLREENDELRRQLEEARHCAQTQSKQVSEVLKEMEIIQQREREETAAIESVVQSVENNLDTATKRAQKAETELTQSKQLIKQLNNRLSELQIENRTLRAGKSVQSNEAIKEKVRNASEQLNSAAITAKATLQQLMGGVDQIKLISEVLASVDKITDASIPTDDYVDSKTYTTGAYGESID